MSSTAAARVSNTTKMRPIRTLAPRLSNPQPGEIWAFPQEPNNNFPRSYARINKLITINNQPSTEATPLNALPLTDDEETLIENNHLLSTGAFRTLESSKITIPISALSHKVTIESQWKARWSSFYKIYPKKGETWAVHLKDFEFKLVEVLGDFREEEDGVDVFALDKVESGVYKRQVFEGFYMMRTILKRDLPVFSHRVPAAEFVDDDGEKLWKVMLH